MVRPAARPVGQDAGILLPTLPTLGGGGFQLSKLPKFYEEFRTQYPEVAQGYQTLGDACRSGGPLDARTVELVKLAIAIAVGAEGGAHSHARRALEQGVKRAELEHVALLAITTLGFPRAMTGLAWIRDVTGVGAGK